MMCSDFRTWRVSWVMMRIGRLAIIALLLAACAPDATAPVAAHATTAATTDLFLIGGLSNARGPEGFYTLADLRDQYGRTGIISWSAWPAFGIRYNALTRRDVAIVNARAGASSQTYEARPTLEGKNWDTPGFLVPRSIATTDSVLALGGYELKGVIMVIGEQDSRFLQSRTITIARYVEATQTMIARYRAHYGPSLPFYFVRSGTGLSGDHYGWKAVRRAQEQVAAADSNVHIVYRGAVNFVERGLQVDEVHWSKEALIEVGRVAAREIADDQSQAASP
jgi:hypothetical protein